MKNREFIPELLIDQSRWDIDAVYVPESDFDFQIEVSRLKEVMDAKDGVNIFLSEGAGLETIVEKWRKRTRNSEMLLDMSDWMILIREVVCEAISGALGAEKTLVQKVDILLAQQSPITEISN